MKKILSVLAILFMTATWASATTYARITKGGETTLYTDVTEFQTTLAAITEGEIYVVLDNPVNLGDEGCLTFNTKTTFDFFGRTLTGRIVVNAPTTIRNTGNQPQGKVVTESDLSVIEANADLTISGGTFEGKRSISLDKGATVTLTGGKYFADDLNGPFCFNDYSSKVVIPDKYIYTDGVSYTKSGTMTKDTDKIMCDGRVERRPIAEVTINGVTTKYNNEEDLYTDVKLTKEGNMSIKLVDDCDMGEGGENGLIFHTPTTLDLNGYTLTGYLSVQSPTTVNDSSEGKTGKVKTTKLFGVISAYDDLTINGGTFEGGYSIGVYYKSTTTINGGVFCANDEYGVIKFQSQEGKVVIADGLMLTDGNGNVVEGTITSESGKVNFAGSVVQAPIAEIILNGVTTKYYDPDLFLNAVYDTKSGEMSVKLLADCDLGINGGNYLEFHTATTFDLNGHTLKGYLYNNAPLTINDSSEGKTGKVETYPYYKVLCADADLTVNGGTFVGGASLSLYNSAVATLNGGTFSVSEDYGLFYIASYGSKVIIPDGYAYSGGTGHSVSGTITRLSDNVMFAGSIVKAPLAEVVVNGVMTKYDDAETLMTAVNDTKEGEMSIKLFADCDLGNDGKKWISFLATSTTFDLNGHTLKGWVYIKSPTTINDSSYGKTGKVETSSDYKVLCADADLTVNGGTFVGGASLSLSNSATATLNGGTYSANDHGAFIFVDDGAKVVIANGCRYTDGGDNSLTGTLTSESAKVMFAGSVVADKATIAEVTRDGVTTAYNNVDVFACALGGMRNSEVSVKLLADCDMGDYGENEFAINTPATFDLNGHTLTAWVYIKAPTTINDSSEGKTGKVETLSYYRVLCADADLTVNGGTFVGGASLSLDNSATATLKGGTYSTDENGAFVFCDDGSKVVIPEGYEYTDGEGNSVTGTLTKASDKVTFAGSVVKTETPTAVDNIDAQNAQNTQKTIKTIKNGEIVIIKGGERFNLRGAKIK